MTLENQVKSGLFWSALERIGTQGVQFVIRIILARILFPDDFGTMAIVIGFLEVSRVFIEGGFGAALIQAKKIESIDVSTVFFVNLFVSVLCCIGLIAAAPAIAVFFSKPILSEIVPLISFTLIIAAFGQAQFNMLIRELQFRKILRISLPAAVTSGSIGIGMALGGWGIWALVWEQIIRSLFVNSMYWVVSRWRPKFEFSVNSFRNLFSFGVYLLGSGIVRRSVENLNVFVIGKAFSTVDLGFYHRARSFQKTPTIALHNIMNRVLFPAFSTIQDETRKLCEALHKGLPMIGFFVFPAMVFLIVAAEPIIISLLTEKWRDSIQYVRLLPIVGMLYPLHAVNISVLKAIGQTKTLFGLSIVRNILYVVSILIGIQFGIIGLIVAQIINSFVGLILNSYFCGKYIGYSTVDQFKDLAPYAVATAIAGLIAYTPTFAFDSLLPVNERMTQSVTSFAVAILRPAYELFTLFAVDSLPYEFVQFQIRGFVSNVLDALTLTYLMILALQGLVLASSYWMLCRLFDLAAMQRTSQWLRRFRKRLGGRNLMAVHAK